MPAVFWPIGGQFGRGSAASSQEEEGGTADEPLSRKTLGVIGEELANQYLRRRGYQMLFRNYRTTVGEIDLIARDRKTIVFVEVRTRRSDVAGTPAESITYRKRTQIIRNAKFFLHRYGMDEALCRFDVVTVLFPEKGEPDVQVIQDAFGE